MQILLCLYFLEILDFLVTDIFLEDDIFLDLANNFDLVKCIQKNKFT